MTEERLKYYFEDSIVQTWEEFKNNRILKKYYVLTPMATVENWQQSNLINWIVLSKVSYRLKQMKMRM